MNNNWSFRDGSFHHHHRRSEECYKLPIRVISFGVENRTPDYRNENTEQPDIPDDFKLCLTVSGRAALEYEGKTTIVRSGDVYLFNSHKNALEYAYDSSWRAVFIHFEGSMGALYHDLLAQSGSFVYHFDNTEKMEEKMLSMVEYVDRSGFSVDEELAFRVGSMLHELYKCSLPEREGAVSDGIYQPIKLAVDYILDHAAEPITTDEICEAVQLSRTTFFRLFKKYTNHTPYSYMHLVRIQNAKSLLLKSRQSVAQIAYGCGFSDASVFIRSFKRQTGLTPQQFRAHYEEIDLQETK